MAFDGVPADAYRRFMGRFSEPLASGFADVGLADPPVMAAAAETAVAKVLDVGCGPGVLTRELVTRLGTSSVTAVDPAPAFVAATAALLPGTDARIASAEALPFREDVFDAALAQLVVHFMADPVAGLREMARVTRPGGRVAACVWDHGGGTGPLSSFWDVAQALDPSAPGESGLPGSTEGELTELFGEARLRDVEETALRVTVAFADFDDWWEPFTFGVGPAGDHVRGLDAERRRAMEAALRERHGSGAFSLTVSAWCATGVVRPR